MNVEQMESRENPAPWIPGWDGPEQWSYGDVNGDGNADTVSVAQMGGSTRVVVLDAPRTLEEIHGERRILADRIFFDESFRGGGRVSVTDRGQVLVLPGPGGGAVVGLWNVLTGEAIERLAPFGTDYRGLMHASLGDVDGDGEKELMLLPGGGYAPRLVAVDLRTFETELSVYVGDPQSVADVRFEPTGGTVRTGDGWQLWLESDSESWMIPIPRE